MAAGLMFSLFQQFKGIGMIQLFRRLLFGGFVYLLYRRSKDKNLLPFFIAHAIGEVFGMGIISYFWT